MFLKSAFISTCLLASVVLADSHRHRRHSFPSPNLASRNNIEEDGVAVGAVFENGIESASATFKLPALSKSDHGTALIVINLDDPKKGCENSLVGGIAVQEPGSSSPYIAFGSFSADQPTIFSDLSFSAGEEVKITVTSHSATKGTITINSHSYHLTTKTPLCKNSAAFGLAANLKDNSNTEYEPLPHFGTFTFDNVKFTTSSGTKEIDSSNAQAADMKIGGARVVKTSVGHGTVVFKQHK